MKIFDSKNIHELDRLTMEQQQITSLELMERAALQVFLWIVNHFSDKKKVFHLFCGVGNNGGDGLVVARLLKQNYFSVQVYVIPFATSYSEDFKTNLQRLKEVNLNHTLLDESATFPTIDHQDIIIDAIFGIGLTRELAPWLQKIILKLNEQPSFKVAIDVPSGLFLTRKTELAIQSDVILTFQFPKLAFFMPENEAFVTEIVILNH